jgi:hypothetical protein
MGNRTQLKLHSNITLFKQEWPTFVPFWLKIEQNSINPHKSNRAKSALPTKLSIRIIQTSFRLNAVKGKAYSFTFAPTTKKASFLSESSLQSRLHER